MNQIMTPGLGLTCLGVGWLFWRAFREPGIHPVWSEAHERGWPMLRWLAGFLLGGIMAATGVLLVVYALFSGEV